MIDILIILTNIRCAGIQMAWEQETEHDMEGTHARAPAPACTRTRSHMPAFKAWLRRRLTHGRISCDTNM